MVIIMFIKRRKYYLPLEKDGALHLNKCWIPFTQGYFVPSFVEIGPVRGFGEEDENVESLRQRLQRWQRQRANFDQKSSLEPSVQVS